MEISRKGDCMKIVAGMGSIDEYEALVKAGADEVFCGYVPISWYQKYGNFRPLNRREVRFYHVQIGSMEDMKILSKMMKTYHVPVTLTFNALYYMPEQYEEIEKIIEELIPLGFNNVIVSDLSLLLYLKENNLNCNIHISGEIGEVNRGFMDLISNDFKANEFRITRQIFHRKNTLQDMESCIKHQKDADIVMEYEAFVLNELCQYTGGFCNSLHCDELVHLCQVPYRLVPMLSKHDKSIGETSKKEENKLEVNDTDEIIAQSSKADESVYGPNEELTGQEKQDDLEESTLGCTGCGLCALYQMKQAGITHLKVVGRGNQIEHMVRDVKDLKEALSILEKATSEQEFQKQMKQQLFKGQCSETCYYR